MSHVTLVDDLCWESCHIYGGVMSHMWMSHVTSSVASHATHETHMDEPCHTLIESCHSYRWVMSRVMSHVEHIRGSDVSHWMSHVTRKMSHVASHVTRETHRRESCHTCEWVMSLVSMSHVASHVTLETNWGESCLTLNESCHSYQWVMSHIEWVMSLMSMSHVASHVTHETNREESCLTLNESSHSYQWVMLRVMTHMEHIYWVMSHMWTRHATRTNEFFARQISHKQAMPHKKKMDESCHAREWVIWENESFEREIELFQQMSRFRKWVISENESFYVHETVCWEIGIRHVTHMNESCHIWMSHVTYEWVMSHMNESCHIWMSHVTYEW